MCIKKVPDSQKWADSSHGESALFFDYSVYLLPLFLKSFSIFSFQEPSMRTVSLIDLMALMAQPTAS